MEEPDRISFRLGIQEAWSSRKTLDDEGHCQQEDGRSSLGWPRIRVSMISTHNREKIKYSEDTLSK